MDGWLDLVCPYAAFLMLAWLYTHPTQTQRDRAQRTQELRDWDWRA